MAKRIKYLIRMLFGGLFFYSGTFHMIRLFYSLWGRRITIVTYHRITDRKMNEIEASLPFLFTSQQVFEKQLLFFKACYRVIPLKELVERGRNGKAPWNSLIITFDDGYEDNFRNAYTSLSRMHLPATFFITSDRIGKDNVKPYWWDRLYYYLREIQKREDREFGDGVKGELSPIYEEFKNNASHLFSRMNRQETDEIERLLDRTQENYQIDDERVYRENRMLNWQQISEMSQNHDFGSHTCSHRNLLRLSDDQKYHEIVESKTIIEKFLGREVSAFSCPAGHMDEGIERFVKEGGYEFAMTTKPGINSMNHRYRLKRINIWEGTSLSLNGTFSKGYLSLIMLGF